MADTSVVKTSGYKYELEKLPRGLQASTDYLKMGGYKFVYFCKHSLEFVSDLTGSGNRLAGLVRKVVECIGPSLAFFTNSIPTWSEASKYFLGLAEACDIMELIGDANYFLNGSFLKDWAKKQNYAILGHVALVPADILTVALYVKGAFKLSFDACAASIGNVRIFGFVPKVAGAVQNWPLFRSIPNLAGKAAWIGDARIFGFVTRASLVTVAQAAAGIAHTYFALDALQRRSKYMTKVHDFRKKLSDRHIVVNSTDKDIINKLAHAGIVAPDQRVDAGNEFVKYKSKLIKLKQARLDLITSISEIAIKAVMIGGVTAGATVGGSVTLGILGAFSFFCLGRAAYHKYSAKAPELKHVIGKNV